LVASIWWSPGSNNNPLSPSIITSVSPPDLAATTALAAAIASRQTSGSPSVLPPCNTVEGTTTHSQSCSSSRFLALPTRPVKWASTASDLPSFSSDSLASPSPQIVKSISGTSAAARSNKSTPLMLVSLPMNRTLNRPLPTPSSSTTELVLSF